MNSEDENVYSDVDEFRRPFGGFHGGMGHGGFGHGGFGHGFGGFRPFIFPWMLYGAYNSPYYYNRPGCGYYPGSCGYF